MSKRRQSLNNADIRSYCQPKRTATEHEKENGAAQGKQSNSADSNHKPKTKMEEATESKEGHSHAFLLKFNRSEKTYDIQCDHPQTVLEAIKSNAEARAKIKCDDDKIILQKGRMHRGTAIATHFPCMCLAHGELVTLTARTEEVEVREAKRDYRVYEDEQYSVVFIDKDGGTNAESKKLFKSNFVKKFKQLCVYGTENMTLKDAIERDGRFVDLGDFDLEDLEKAHVSSGYKIQQNKEKTFKICFKINTTKKAGEASLKVSDEAGPSRAGQSASGKAAETDTAEAGPRNTGTKGATNSTGTMELTSIGEILKRKQDAGSTEKDCEEILNLLRNQFPDLKKQLLDRMSQSTETDLTSKEKVKILREIVKKVDFGKAQQAFSEVGRVKKLFELANSVCVIACNKSNIGSGFVLFQNYILTNAHLFKTIVCENRQQCEKIPDDIQVTAMFYYEESIQQNVLTFKVKNTFIDYDENIDYAILELDVSEENKDSVPSGLMKNCCPMPETGEACLIGHPGGGVKKFDPTCIIEKENRASQSNQHLQQYKDSSLAMLSVFYQAKNQGIDRIWTRSDPMYDNVSTYNTFMYHGSSGSSVFDGHCRLFGMHTGGFTYDLPTKGSVIEYALPVLLIFKQFITNLRNRENTDLLNRVDEEFKEFPYREEIGLDEQMDQS